MLIGVSGNHAATTSGIGPSEEEPARAREGQLQPRGLRIQRRVWRPRAVGDRGMSLLELRTELWLEDVEAGRQRPARHERLEDRQRRGQRDVSFDEFGDE